MDTMAEAAISALNAGVVKIGHLRINRLGFGAMRLTGPGVWGMPEHLQEAHRVLRRAVELDINFIDTADAYGPNVSEQLIHDTLYPYEGILIATKGGMLRGGPDNWYPDGSPKHLSEALDGSLARLGVEKINLYQFHRPDPAVPFRTSLQTLIELKNAGKIRHLGLSNVTLDQLKEALDMTPIVSVQNHYNFEHRRDSDGIVDFCEQRGIAFIPYFPIGGGRRDYTQHVLQLVAGKHDATPQQIALAWLLQRSPVMLPIPGTSSVAHLEENVAAASIQLTNDDVAKLDSLSD